MAEEKKTLKMKDINETLSDYKVQDLEGVILEGDIEIEMDISSAQQLMAQALGQDFTRIALQLLNLSKAMGYPADFMFQTDGTSVVNK